MKSFVLVASLLAAAAATTPARAADLDEGPPPDRYGAYEDPRYSDMYAHPRPPAYVPPPNGHHYGEAPVPPGYVYRGYQDEDDRYDSRGRYAYAEPPPPYARGCAPREEIKERLLRQGWRDFRDAEERGELVTIIARRPSGRPFALTVERCSGEIVNARPLDQSQFAYGPPLRRWERPY
jgi:hypothetical protein